MNTADLIAAEWHLRQALQGNPGCNKDDLFNAWIRVRDLLRQAKNGVIDVEFRVIPRFDPVTSRDLMNWPNIEAR